MINLRIWFIGMLFGLIETAYFGWNFTPKTDGEMICDGIVFIIFAMSVRKP